MNLYKVLNDVNREFVLHESMVKSSEKKSTSLRARRNKRFKESTEVNVSNNGDSTDVNIVIDNKKPEVPVTPIAPEPVAEEVTTEVEEPTEDLPLEEESDKKDCEGKDCKDVEECDSKDSVKEAEKGKKVPIHNEVSMDEVISMFRQMVKDNPKNEKAKEFLRKYDPEFKESDEVEEVDSKESNGPTKAAEKLNEIIKILDEEGSVDFDIVRYNISVALEWLAPYIKDSDNEEVIEEEPLEECEVKSFNILRMSPKGSLYMIEADKVDNSRVFIVGRNFDSKTNMLDEAEIFNDKDKATSKFRDILYTVNNSKKGE